MSTKKPRQKSDRPYYSSDYRKVGRNHNAWYEKAGGLAQAALLLRTRVVADFTELDEYMQGFPSEREMVHRFPLYRIYPIYMMLIGLSIENVLKSICVVRYPDSVRDQMHKKLAVHDVYELATARLHLGHVLTDDEKDLLKRLSEFIAWRGKYTIPRTSREWQIAMESGYYVGPKSLAEFLKDDAVYEALSQKLVDVLGSELTEKEDDRRAVTHL